SAVVIEPSGACFTHVREDGSLSRQLSDFCRRDLVPHLAAVCRFRNAHSPRPYLSHRIHGTQEQQGENSSTSSTSSSRRRKRATLHPVAHWPAVGSGQGSSAALCAVRADGAVEVRAAGGNARLTLSASRTVAEVDYAAAVPGSTAHAAAVG
ncbi:unnamed protein product, partial [Hapterophycus canaliculatus]